MPFQHLYTYKRVIKQGWMAGYDAHIIYAWDSRYPLILHPGKCNQHTSVHCHISVFKKSATPAFVMGHWSDYI